MTAGLMIQASTDRKLFLGARLKRFRRELGITQTRMAEDLGVSPSYLNLLERNQRPVTAQVLLRLAEAYDRSEEHTSELQSREKLVCRLLLEKKKEHVMSH